MVVACTSTTTVDASSPATYHLNYQTGTSPSYYTDLPLTLSQMITFTGNCPKTISLLYEETAGNFVALNHPAVATEASGTISASTAAIGLFNFKYQYVVTELAGPVTYAFTFSTNVFCDVQMSTISALSDSLKADQFTGNAPNYLMSLTNPSSYFTITGTCLFNRYELWIDPGTGFVNATDPTQSAIADTNMQFTTSIPNNYTLQIKVASNVNTTISATKNVFLEVFCINTFTPMNSSGPMVYIRNPP